jgi:FAD-linked sulfhydryl oxidase
MNNIDPEYWGRPSWIFLYSIGFSYPDNPTQKDKKSIKKLLILLKDILPCYRCRINYKDTLKNIPLTDNILDNRKNLLKWMLQVHNKINIQIGKKQMNYGDLMDYIR